jgi:hypothetical protein
MHDAAMAAGVGDFEKGRPMSRRFDEKSYLRGDNSAVAFEAEAYLQLLFV